jgi:hypothetical protein
MPRSLKILLASSWVVLSLCLVALLFLAVATPNVISDQMIKDSTKDVQEIRASTDLRWLQQIATFRTQMLAGTMDQARTLLALNATVILLCGFSAGISLWQLCRLKRHFMERDLHLMLSNAQAKALAARILLDELRAGRIETALELLEQSMDTSILMIDGFARKAKPPQQASAAESLRIVRKYRQRHPRKTEAVIDATDDGLEKKTTQEKVKRILDEINGA